MALPFLKYAGGKRELLPQIKELMPENYGRYFEPFLGGGALFFDLAPDDAWINDVNCPIIDIYRAVAHNVDYVIGALGSLTASYAVAPAETYKTTRDQFNEALIDIGSADPDARCTYAAYGIFLNKTCFNGLWRTNRKGFFNVPSGNYANPAICDADRLRAAAKILRKASVNCGSFLAVEAEARESDFVYFDPPYVPTSKTSNFTAYARGGFSLKDHEDLADLAARLKSRGVHVLLSNSHTPETLRMYSNRGFEIFEVECSRSINSKASGRAPVKELLIR
jgi:DNA adenine methylase